AAGYCGCAARDRRRGAVLLQVAAPLGARDRHDVVALRQHPGDRELRGRDALLGGERLDPFDDREVALEVALLEARMPVADVLRREVPGAPELPGEEPAAERAVG